MGSYRAENRLIDFCHPPPNFAEAEGDLAAVSEETRFEPSPRIIGDEARWRMLSVPTSPSSRILATRWATEPTRVREATSRTGDDQYVIAVSLRQMNIRYSMSGRVVWDGTAPPGMIHVHEPSASALCLFRGSHDSLHLHLSRKLLDEYFVHRRSGASIDLRSEPDLKRDPVVLQLGLDLLKAEELAPSFGQIYADGLSLAIVTRLLAAQSRGWAASKPAVASMSKWRLKRAIEFIEAHLDAPISLADLAAASGLSRMHFAAQFKAATGCRPHDYVLHRRISRAQELMLKSTATLVDVSLQVGFQSQAHFTTVFRRFVGMPPRAWRLSHDTARCAPDLSKLSISPGEPAHRVKTVS